MFRDSAVGVMVTDGGCLLVLWMDLYMHTPGLKETRQPLDVSIYRSCDVNKLHTVIFSPGEYQELKRTPF